GAVISVPSMPAAALALLAFGGAWLCIWLGRWRLIGLAPMALGYCAIALERPPDLFVAADGRAVAVRAPDGHYLPSSPQGGRLIEGAVRRVGAAMGPSWPEAGSSAEGALRCDAEACLYRAQSRIVALERDGGALAQDCRAADLVVSPVAAHRACRGPRIIDRIDTARKGGHAVWLESDRIRIETV